MTACATKPPATAFDRPITHALPATEITPLSTALAPLEAAHPGQSGFRVLSSGTDALQMRIALARAATKTLDMQYYIANEDTTGKLLLGAALYAADHGVRVRMLVDDLNFKDIDRLMAGLNSHDNIEIRVFNPFGSAQEGVFERTTNLFTQIGHFTRRMHNKAMIADNQLAIVGGRNLGDEYFSASETLQFRDLDVLAAGPITADVSASFDDYWNSSISYPLRVLNKQKFDQQELDAHARRSARALAHQRRSVQRETAERDAARAADRRRITRPHVGARRIQGGFAGKDRTSIARLRQPADAAPRRTDARRAPGFPDHFAVLRAARGRRQSGGRADAARRAHCRADQFARRHRRGRRAGGL